MLDELDTVTTATAPRFYDPRDGLFGFALEKDVDTLKVVGLSGEEKRTREEGVDGREGPAHLIKCVNR